MAELHDFNQRVIREFRANQGKVSGQLANMPVLLLTMTGARSGRTMTTPLVYTTDGNRLVVIASFAGAPKHPAWYHNLLAHPEATVEVGSERFRVKATVTAGLTITHIDCLSVWPHANPRPATSSHVGHATRSVRQASRPSDD